MNRKLALAQFTGLRIMTGAKFTLALPPWAPLSAIRSRLVHWIAIWAGRDSNPNKPRRWTIPVAPIICGILWTPRRITALTAPSTTGHITSAIRHGPICTAVRSLLDWVSRLAWLARCSGQRATATDYAGLNIRSTAFRFFAAVLVLDESFGFWCSRKRMSAFRKIIGSCGSQRILSPLHNHHHPERKSPTIFLIAATNN